MTRLTRRILFIVFVCAFFILAPILVLYTAGYQYSLTDGVQLQSGGLAVTTNPRRFDIFLNDEYARERTPHIFQRLEPGSYSVSLEKEGFYPWRGQLDIEAGLTEYIQSVQLFEKHEKEFERVLPTNSFSVNPDGSRIVYSTSEGGWLDFWLLDIEKDALENLGRIQSNANVEASWSASGNYFAFFGSGEILVYDAEKGSRINLPLEPQFITSATWHQSLGSLLYLSGDRATLEYNLETGQVAEIEEDFLIRLSESEIILLKKQDTASVLTRKSDSAEREILALPSLQYEVFAYQSPFLILRDARDELFLFNTEKDTLQILDMKADQAAWINKLASMVYTDGNEVALFFADQNRRDLITRISSTVKGVFWHPEGQRVFYLTNTGITAIDTFLQGKVRDQVKLADGSEIMSSWISQNGHKIYFIDRINNQFELYSLDIN